jgi:hypothetical protein
MGHDQAPTLSFQVLLRRRHHLGPEHYELATGAFGYLVTTGGACSCSHIPDVGVFSLEASSIPQVPVTRQSICR